MSNLDEYHMNYRPEMIPFVPSSAKTLLEIGCGGGEFARALLGLRSLEIWGVEPEKNAAATAATVMAKVFSTTYEECASELPLNFFDAIILNDVIEHMREPLSALKAMAKHLKPSGHLVASIPNVRYFENLKNLLIHKDWKYEDSGILDRTHLRFFTEKSIIRLFEDGGFKVEKIIGINPYCSWKWSLLNRILLNTIRDTRYLQFAILAQSTVEQ